MRRSELLAKAMEDVRACRQRAVTLAERNKQRAYDKVPRLLVLDNLTIETGLALARLAAARAPESALAEKRAALKAIETERAALLAENGFAADFLQPHFHCRFCQDTGTTANGLCGCVEERIRALRREELLGIAPLSECRFDNFDLLRYPDIIVPPQRVSAREVMRNNLDYCRQYADGFGADCPSVFMTGDAGLGKTHLALSIAGVVLARGFNVLYVSSQSAFGVVEKDRFDDGGETLQAMLEAELLILDDLGTEYLTPYVASCIYRLVDTRLTARRPTIYTSNIQTQKTLNARYTEKVGSRLFGDCEILRFWGDDLRLAKKLGTAER